MSESRLELTSAVRALNERQWPAAPLGLSSAADRLFAEGRTSDADKALELLAVCAKRWQAEQREKMRHRPMSSPR